jgi:chemotaxis protein histidine kinase CheA
MLKGTAGTFGFDRLTELAKHIEDAIVAGREAEAAQLCEGLVREARGAASPVDA